MFSLITFQFVEALSLSTRLAGEKRVLSLDKPVTDVDYEFLRTIFVPANKNSSTLTFPQFFNDEKLQGYAIVLKILSGKTWNATHMDRRNGPQEKLSWTYVIKKVEDIFFKLHLKIAYRFHCCDQG